MVRIVFGAFVLLALLGDARVFLFVLNRFVFGSHREEKSPWQWLMYVVPPGLLLLTLLFWPVNVWIERLMSTPLVERVTPERVEELALSILLAKIGAAWLIIAAAIGSYWVLERIRALAFAVPPPTGTRDLPSKVVALRKAHVPFAWIRRLGAHNDVYDIEVTHHEVIVDDLPEAFDGYRIAFLTDTHITGFMRRNFYREVVAQTLAFDPDVIVLGGDLVTFSRDIPLMAELLGELRARDGVVAVLGNHDIWAGAEHIIELLTAKGVTYVTNRSLTLSRKGARLPLIGIDEMYRGAPDVARAFAGVAPGPCIAVSHHPDIIDLLEGQRIDLLLCGHTHGGQIRLPFFGPVVVPSVHETEFASGFHRIRGVLMYVSRGVGAIPPLRILCRPEVATFILRRGQRADDR
jgi:predicted MPP superfamily phosphohydrolase